MEDYTEGGVMEKRFMEHAENIRIIGKESVSEEEEQQLKKRLRAWEKDTKG